MVVVEGVVLRLLLQRLLCSRCCAAGAKGEGEWGWWGLWGGLVVGGADVGWELRTQIQQHKGLHS